MTDPTGPGPDALDSVRTGLLDCIQVNLAVLADQRYGPGTHLRLGAPLAFRCWQQPAGLPTVDPPLQHHLDRLPELLGLRAVRRERLTGAGLLAAAAERGGTHYVVADSFQLPWLPYHGQAHMEHSFLLAAGPDGWQVTDGYRSETPWGPAAPVRRLLAEHDLAGLGSAELVTLEPADGGPPAGLAPTLSLPGSAIEEYLSAYDACPDRARAVQQLTVETWLLVRARKLHAEYRTRLGGPDATARAEAVTEHLRAWDRLVEQTYLAHRRVSRGRAEPAGLVERLRELLLADPVVFGAVRTPAPPDPAADQDQALRRRVAAVAGAVLGVPVAELLAGAPFDSFASFSSFRLIELVERLESELDRELDADDLVPENLLRVDDLCRIAR